jgi:hypothetical protein
MNISTCKNKTYKKSTNMLNVISPHDSLQSLKSLCELKCCGYGMLMWYQCEQK